MLLAAGFPRTLRREVTMLYSDPFETLLQLQQALDSFHASSWLSTSTSGAGGGPPLNVFRNGGDVVMGAVGAGRKEGEVVV